MSLIAERLLHNSDFSCTLTRLFQDCPTLPSVAAQRVSDEWEARSISTHPPAGICLQSISPNAEYDNTRPLSQVLIERYCQRSDMLLRPSTDTLLASANDVTGIDVDLNQVQRLVNDCGPVLLDDYRQALVDYWNQVDGTGQSTWQRYSSYLRQQLSDSIGATQPGTIDPALLALAAKVATYPSHEARQLASGTAKPKLTLLSLDLAQGLRLHDLTGALLVTEDSDNDDNPVVLYTLSGDLQVFASFAALQQAFGQLWPELVGQQPELQSRPITGNAFDALASQVLEQQLSIIDRIAERHSAREDAQHLCVELSHLTLLLDLCPKAQRESLRKSAGLLPTWLHNANEHSLFAYAHSLIDIAQKGADAKGATWLDGIDDAATFAYTRINEYFGKIHPEHDLEPWDVEVINHQTIASALPTGQMDGTVTPIHFTLAHLVIGNWGLIRPGRVELRHKKGKRLPDWLTESYLQTMITELNIAKVYPQMLQDRLLDDLPERKRRERLLADQLRTQLPAGAMALELSEHLSPRARRAVSAVFAAPTGRWLIRPFGLVRETGAAADLVLNAWLIEPVHALPGDPCILYRPLHTRSLLEFTDRTSLLCALGKTGALQDDILRRLDHDVRRIYDNDGFAEPNLPGLMEMTLLGIPYQKPAPATLASEPAITHWGQAIYQGCVEETIADFRANSTTTEQARWERWTALGWLLLNCALPLVNGPLGTLVWLTQIAMALKQFLQTGKHPDSSQHRIALVNLLVNVGLALFAHAAPRLQLQRPAHLADEAGASLAEPPHLQYLEAGTPGRLEHQWATTEAQMNSTQSTALEALRSSRTSEELGMPIVTGELRGLYLQGEHYWTILGGGVYRVTLDEAVQQPRIVSDTQPSVPGPWLRRGSSGRWQPDLRLRLRGGMPGGKRRQAFRAQNAERREALSRQIIESRQQILSHNRTLLRLTLLVQETSNPEVLGLTLNKLDDIEVFWDTFLANVEEQAVLTNVTPANDVKASWEFQRFHVTMTRGTLLSKLILQKLTPAPVRVFAKAEDHAAYMHALDEITPQTEKLISNVEGIGKHLIALERLAGSRGTARDLYVAAKGMLKVPIERSILASRLLRLEYNWRKFMALPDLADRTQLMLDRCSINLTLAISQRMRLYEMPQASEALSARLLHDIDSQLGVALRRLENLKLIVTANPAALDALAPIEADVRYVNSRVKADLQDYPPLSSVAQLQRHTPGLIETPSHGLLLGKPRTGDDTLFDVVDDNQRPLMTFHKRDEEWIPVEQQTSHPVPQEPAPSLRRLFETADAEQTKARHTLNLLESSVAQHFQPVEFEELIDMHVRPLTDTAATLSTRLSKETDMTSAARQGYRERLVALRALVDQLNSKRVTLRTQAILRQSPRQSGLQYLIEHDLVQISRQGRRRALSAVPGRPQDYLDEYVISYANEPLWYAHFHYTSHDAASSDFVAGHLKTSAQRRLRGHSVTDPVTQELEYVHRGPLTQAAASRYFFNT
ncbi:hypothetical protein ACIPW4_26375 [Pseudomonas sp. NPDC089996]|uniref:hypothetical protein n=1 Tax=Pseudomonas sp. NPDC089996 TaxID=3364474 RepID=UPI0037F1F283